MDRIQKIILISIISIAVISWVLSESNIDNLIRIKYHDAKEELLKVYGIGNKIADSELISPDNWNMDFRFMECPGARQV